MSVLRPLKLFARALRPRPENGWKKREKLSTGDMRILLQWIYMILLWEKVWDPRDIICTHW